MPSPDWKLTEGIVATLELQEGLDDTLEVNENAVIAPLLDGKSSRRT